MRQPVRFCFWRLTPHIRTDIESSHLVFGKRGSSPPLPRNCNRRELDMELAPATEGFLGKAVQIR
jgi:hypothetical protein